MRVSKARLVGAGTRLTAFFDDLVIVSAMFVIMVVFVVLGAIFVATVLRAAVFICVLFVLIVLHNYSPYLKMEGVRL